jgi:hypothetical protein
MSHTHRDREKVTAGNAQSVEAFVVYKEIHMKAFVVS